jgi:hypothetical protein
MPSNRAPSRSGDIIDNYRELLPDELPQPGDEYTHVSNSGGNGFLSFAGYCLPIVDCLEFRWRTTRPLPEGASAPMRVLLDADGVAVGVVSGDDVQYARLSPDFYHHATYYHPDGSVTRGLPVAALADTVVDFHGRSILHRNSVHIRSRVYHQSSPDIFQCDDCNAYELRTHRHEVFGNTHVCGCCEPNYQQCSSCDILVHEDDAHEDEDGDTLCPTCHGRHCAERPRYGVLLSYSDKTICNVKPEQPNKQLFGVEVECHVLNHESIDNAVARLHRSYGRDGYYVTKSDGSLIHGFEVVTRPDSMEVHRREWVRMFNAIAENEWLKQHLRSWAAPSRCCGIHVHIDKSSLSQMQLGKMLVFLNDENTRRFVQKVAGRGANSYTTFEDGKKVIEGKKLKYGTSPNRYVALNVGSKTAEIRIFRGTLNPESFFKNLDFVEALVEWTGLANGCSLTEAANPEAFCKFVHTNAHRWPFLNNKLLSWGF